MMLRTAAPADAESLARLRYDFRSALGAPEEPEREFLARCASWMRPRLAPESCWRCWVAESEGRLVGTIWLQIIEKLPNPVAELERHGYVSSLYVEPEWRGQGTGSALLATCLESCDVLGVDAIILWPTADSRRLYARHGFAVPEDLFERRMGS
jgi:GNAT superfamily N-acetyltransferase